MERFKKLQKLGDGAFGSVFKAEDVNTGEIGTLFLHILFMVLIFYKWRLILNKLQAVANTYFS